MAWTARIVLAGLATLASAPPVSAQSFAERFSTCLACHGEKGQSETPDTPSLGAQPSAAMLIQLYLFREKRRTNEIMSDAARMERGRELAQKNRCGFCHNPDFSGRDNLPRLAAQREDYLVKALRDYKSGARPGYDPQMQEVLPSVTDDQIADLAYFLARQR